MTNTPDKETVSGRLNRECWCKHSVHYDDGHCGYSYCHAPQPTPDKRESFEELLRASLRKAYQNGLTDVVARANGVITDAHAKVAEYILDNLANDLLNNHYTELLAVLEPFTRLQEELNATHFEKCKICGEPSHRCMCDEAMRYVEAKALAAVAKIKEKMK